MRLAHALVCLLAAAPLVLIAGPSGAAYEEVAVANGGAIKGQLTYTGRVPTRTVIPTKDKEVCGDMREEPQIMVGPDNGVGDAVVYLERVAQGKAWEQPAEPPTIDNKDCRFVPHIQIVPTGKIVVVNSDPVLHNTHGFYGRRTAFNMALPNEGQRIEAELRRPGTVRVECDAHGWMLAWIYVADSPYYVRAAEDGSYSLTDVPPGDYTLVVEQAFLGRLERPVTVEAGQELDLSLELKKSEMSAVEARTVTVRVSGHH